MGPLPIIHPIKQIPSRIGLFPHSSESEALRSIAARFFEGTSFPSFPPAEAVARDAKRSDSRGAALCCGEPLFLIPPRRDRRPGPVGCTRWESTLLFFEGNQFLFSLFRSPALEKKADGLLLLQHRDEMPNLSPDGKQVTAGEACLRIIQPARTARDSRPQNRKLVRQQILVAGVQPSSSTRVEESTLPNLTLSFTSALSGHDDLGRSIR
jgi:hypothetical protein